MNSSSSVSPSRASVCAASVATELHRASLVAHRLSLSAKNARVVVLRAGSQAASLKVISDFFDTLASQTIQIASQINHTALDISQMAVQSWRAQQFAARLHQAKAFNRTLEHDPAIRKCLARQERIVLTERYRKGLHILASELDEILHFMRAANVISVTSRLEATQTGRFEETLVHMANTIQQQSDVIKDHVMRSQRLIQDLI